MTRSTALSRTRPSPGHARRATPRRAKSEVPSPCPSREKRSRTHTDECPRLAPCAICGPTRLTRPERLFFPRLLSDVLSELLDVRSDDIIGVVILNVPSVDEKHTHTKCVLHTSRKQRLVACTFLEYVLGLFSLELATFIFDSEDFGGKFGVGGAVLSHRDRLSQKSFGQPVLYGAKCRSLSRTLATSCLRVRLSAWCWTHSC